MNQTRREVRSRNKTIFHKLAKLCIAWGLNPNQISILSTVFALVGAYGFYLIATGYFWMGCLLGLFGIQLRLICNLIDGLMAVEGNMSSEQGELYNDVPDRFSDWFLLMGAGWVVADLPQGWNIAWLASMFAVLTAYVRVLGASQKVGHDFGGPMAKQHRMAILNLAILGLMIEKLFANGTHLSLYLGLCIIALGSFVTVFRRLSNIARQL